MNEVSFDVRAGEILGIAGVDGNGQAELEEALTGLRRIEKGSIELDGVDVTAMRPAARRGWDWLTSPPTGWAGAPSVKRASLRTSPR